MRKMNCKKARILCLELLDDRLNERGKKALFSHLSACPDCASFYRQTKKVKQLMVALPTPELDPSFNTIVRSRIERREKELPHRIPFFPLRRRLALLIIPLVMLVFSFVFFLHKKPVESELLRLYRQQHYIYTLQNPLISNDSAVKMLLISGQE